MIAPISAVQWEQQVRRDAVARTLNVLERNLVLGHTEGLRGVNLTDENLAGRLRAIRQLLHPGEAATSHSVSGLPVVSEDGGAR